ncbi:MAG: DoxX family protein [Candidatus Sericytochromatia bacterium]
MNKKKTKIIYWITTLLFLLPTAGSGIPELFFSAPEQVVNSLIKLSYPLYITKILGLAKILGAIAIFYDKKVKLKEWAYAGFTFLFIGAMLSHILAGDAVNAPAPFIILIIMSVSYFTWNKIITKDII